MKENPLLQPFDTPFGVPPFDQIRDSDYKEAFQQGIEQQNAEIRAIVDNPEPPGFANTVEALEHSGRLLNRTNTIFENILSAHTNETL